MLRSIWYLDPRLLPAVNTDELLYISAGSQYLAGLQRGNFTAFQFNAEHPPLSKILTALSVNLGGYVRLPALISMRILDAALGALTCMLLFVLLLRVSRKIAYIGWILLAADPISIRYATASLDVTMTFFLMLFSFLLVSRKYPLAGVVGGLATLSKYPAIAAVMLSALFLLASGDVRGIQALRRLAVVGFPLVLVIFIGDPILWPSQIIGYSGIAVLNSATSSTLLGGATTFFSFLAEGLRSSNAQAQMNLLQFFGLYLTVFYFPFFTSSYLPWTFSASLLDRARRRVGLSQVETAMLAWFCGLMLVLWLITKKGDYYVITLMPPLAAFSATSLSKLIGTKGNAT
jgi:predicted membrane-bound dolichyl-phosphate-mannose-protein mannosyltransferase